MRKRFIKQDRQRFEKEIKALINGFSTFSTKYGLYDVSRVEASDRVLSVYGRFVNPFQLPGEAIQGLYGPFKPNGSFYGWGYNGYSGKWNFHFGENWTVDGAINEFECALRYIGVDFDERDAVIASICGGTA